MVVSTSSHKGLQIGALPQGGRAASRLSRSDAMRSAFARNVVKRNKLQKVNHIEIKFFFSLNFL